MIYVVGAQDTREYGAALELRDMIVRVSPSVVDSPMDTVGIVSGATCHGQSTRDIDILLFANFNSTFEFEPSLTFEKDGQFHRPDKVQVVSLCAVIEVKDHPAEAIRFR